MNEDSQCESISPVGTAVSRLLDRTMDFKRVAFNRMRPMRRVILSLAVLAFLAGATWAASELGISWKSIRYSALGYCLLLLVPSLWLNAAELQLCARALGSRMPFVPALSVSSWATIANLLPLPAGAMLRGAALARAGASLADCGLILSLAAVLWLAIALAVTALVVPPSTASVAVCVAAILAATATACWIGRIGGLQVASGFVAVRTLLLALTIGRLFYCFDAFGYAASFNEAAIYASASVVGAIVGIAPAGLGITEGIGAALAALMEKSPAAAFLALGINRLAGLAGAALICAYLVSRGALAKHSGEGP